MIKKEIKKSYTFKKWKNTIILRFLLKKKKRNPQINCQALFLIKFNTINKQGCFSLLKKDENTKKNLFRDKKN